VQCRKGMNFHPRTPLLNQDLQRPDAQQSVPRAREALWLDKNENLDPALLAVTGKLLREIDTLAMATYPECGLLYRKLSEWVGVTPESLLLTPGSDGAIRMVFEAFVGEGDVVVHTLPTFAMYPVYCQMFGANSAPVTYLRGADGPSLSVDVLIGHLEKMRPRLFCLPNPDSPTGTVFSPDELRRFVDMCARTGSVMLVDEAYHPFYDWTCVPWISSNPHLIVARTFAKAWGLAGLRLGYAVGHPDTLKYLHKLRPMYETGALAVSVMEKMFDRLDDMRASVMRLGAGKRFFADAMRDIGFRVLSTEGNFLHVEFGASAPLIHQALAGKVFYRKDFPDACLKGFSRFSSTTVELFEPVVDSIRDAIEGGPK
jgi:histidinol-phosphate aminotransferase